MTVLSDDELAAILKRIDDLCREAQNLQRQLREAMEKRRRDDQLTTSESKQRRSRFFFDLRFRRRRPAGCAKRGDVGTYAYESAPVLAQEAIGD